MAKIGFIGLGVMGSRMAKRLLNVGHTVTGHDLIKTKAQTLIGMGMLWEDTPRAVAEAVDITITMVTDTEALLAVTRGADGILSGLQPGKVFIDMSTVSPAASREVAIQVAAKGAYMLDAPVSGSVMTVEQGQLSIMVGGDEAVFQKVKPVLESLGSKITYIGSNGLAISMKVAINLNLGVQMLAFSEGMILAEKSGIPRQIALAAMLDSVAASPMLKYRGPFVLEMPEEAWFNVNMMQKDLQLALEAGRQLDVPLPSTALASQMLVTTKSMGLGDKDCAIVFQALARMSGLST